MQEEIEFNTSQLTRVNGTVLIPKNGNKTHPAVIAIHDHGAFYYFGREKIVSKDNEPDILKEFKLNYYGGRSWANELVSRGFLVLCIDGFYFGAQKVDVSKISDDILEACPVKPHEFEPGTDDYIRAFNKFSGWFEALMVKHIFYSGCTWPGILFHDDRKCIDYLNTRHDVDKNRIGCCGLSIGGFRSAHLAALDSRIKCGVVTGWMPTIDSLLFDHLRNHTYMVYIPNLSRYMELPDLASLAAPNYLFVQQCGQDHLYPLEGMENACKAIENVYRKAGCAKNFKYEFYDNDHQFNIKMQEDAFLWLEQHL
jgi:dienelactone hydrolase